jgi:hypothetical protein
MSDARARRSGRALLASHRVALATILAGAAVLNLNRLSQNGYANIFYSAGVRSMLHSLHNFFFVSFDPGGLISIDKPPLALWVQALSAKIFGFSTLALLLPEALAGILTVAVIYHVVARHFGVLAGLAGALALAVFPSFVAVSRDNMTDPLLILLLTLACGAALRAVGYAYLPEYESWLPGELFFRKGPPGPWTHHVHAMETSHPRWQHRLLFRDYLRAHPEAASAYGKLKRDLAAAFGDDIAGYRNAKAAFCEATMAQARGEPGPG